MHQHRPGKLRDKHQGREAAARPCSQQGSAQHLLPRQPWMRCTQLMHLTDGTGQNQALHYAQELVEKRGAPVILQFQRACWVGNEAQSASLPPSHEKAPQARPSFFTQRS